MPGIGLLLILATVPSADDLLSDSRVLANAETEFHAGVENRFSTPEAQMHFHRAAELYEELRCRGVEGEAINHNLGNAYLLSGDFPRAILTYRRALGYAGSDRQIHEALAFARSQVAYPNGGYFGLPPVEQRPPWLPRLSPGWYAGFGFVFYYLGWSAVTYWRTGRPGRWHLWAVLCLFAAFILVVVWVAEERRDADFMNRPVVVLSDDGVLLRTGNGLSYPPRSETPLNRGVEARLLFVRGDWLQIELSGGEIGWVSREYALVDEPGGK
jgi:hypothetical protein